MGAFGDIQNQLGNLTNLTNVFGGGASSLQYPTSIGAGISHDQVTNVPNYNDKSWQQSRGYSFNVVRVTLAGAVVSAGKGWSNFDLQINPQELTQDEIFAIEVTPTLRGVLVEHHGTILKDITISGTTGISPLRAAGGANANSGAPILQKGRSGFQEFHELRSYFRMYSEAKRLDDRAGGELRMVFLNKKDNEGLYVEPQKFSMKRSASRPMLYDYSIALKGIGVYGAASSVNAATSIFGQIDNIIDTVTSSIQLATQVISGAIGIITGIERSVASAILGPLNAINSALVAIKGGEAQLLGSFNITKLFCTQLQSDLTTIGDNLADVFGIPLASSGYNAVVGRTSQLTAATGATPTFQQYQVLNSFQQAYQAVAMVISQPSLFVQDAEQSTAAIQATMNQDPNSNFQFLSPNSVRPMSILDNDTLQVIAARELGSPDRYRDLIVLNNLKSPYINTTGSPIPGTLQPGDTILLPQETAGVDTGILENKIFNITANMTEAERAMGVDIMLTADADMAISNIGDAELVAGMANLAQAISIKLVMEIGGLKRHPSIGTGLITGEKMTTNILNNIRTNILSSLGQDPRIDSIPYLVVQVAGSTTSINMTIKPASIAQPIPLPINVNNG